MNRRTKAIKGLGELSYDARQPCGLPYERFRTRLRFKDGYDWLAFQRDAFGEQRKGRPSAAAIARQLGQAKRWLFEEYQQSCEPYRVAAPERPGCAPVCDPAVSQPCGNACIPLTSRCRKPPRAACSFEEAYGRFAASAAAPTTDYAEDAAAFVDDEPFDLFGLARRRRRRRRR